MTATEELSNQKCSIHHVFQRVQEEAMKSCAYFHTWWSLDQRGLSEYRSTINELMYVDFFRSAYSGFFDLFFVSLSKLFDRTQSGDQEVLGFKKLRETLNQHGFTEEAQLIKQRLEPKEEVIKRIRGIRNKAISHNEAALTREAVFDLYPVTPNEIRELIHEIRDVLNEVGRRIDYPNGISDGERSERAVIAVLETLRRGRSPGESPRCNADVRLRKPEIPAEEDT